MSVSSLNFSVTEDTLMPVAANSFQADPEVLMSWRAALLMATILRSSELKQVISTLGSTKLSETAAVRFRSSFTVEIIETGLPSSEQKTS